MNEAWIGAIVVVVSVLALVGVYKALTDAA